MAERQTKKIVKRKLIFPQTFNAAPAFRSDLPNVKSYWPQTSRAEKLVINILVILASYLG